MDYFKENGILFEDLNSISPKEALNFLENGAVLVDVREEFMTHIKIFDVPKQINYPITKLMKTLDELPSDSPMIFADATGIKSKAAYDLALRNGFTKTANMAGGIVEWERQGLPTTTYQKIKVSGRNRCEFIDIKKNQ